MLCRPWWICYLNSTGAKCSQLLCGQTPLECWRQVSMTTTAWFGDFRRTGIHRGTCRRSFRHTDLLTN